MLNLFSPLGSPLDTSLYVNMWIYKYVDMSITIVFYTQSAIYHCLSHLGKKYTLGFTIHRGALVHDYFQIRIHEDELQSSILIYEIF